MLSYIVGFKEGQMRTGIESLKDVFARHGGKVQNTLEKLEIAVVETTEQGAKDIKILPDVASVNPNGRIRAM